jgi:predicted transglutaminase-like cysteine proteinase
MTLGAVLMAGAFGAQSIAADSGDPSSSGQDAFVFDVPANLPVGFESDKPDAVSPHLASAVAGPAKRDFNRRATHSSWPTSAKFFTINQVLAKAETKKPANPNVQLANITPKGIASDAAPGFGELKQGTEPFGLFTFKAPDGRLTVKWQTVESGVKAEAHALARCRNEPKRCTPGEARFERMMKQSEALGADAKVEFINREINAAIRYTSDLTQWREPDVWSPPVTAAGNGSFDTGLGDCEDYAIAKYVALRQAGFAAESLRVLLVRDRTVGMDHAILAIRQHDRWMLLDNRWDRLIRDTDATQFVPLFALNDQGVKLIAAPYASLQGGGPAPALVGHEDAAEDTMPSWGLPSDGAAQAGGSALPLLM